MRRFAVTVTILFFSLAARPENPIANDGYWNFDSQKPEKYTKSEPAPISTSKANPDQPTGQNEEQGRQAPASDRTYKVDIVSQPASRRDPWFIAYVILTGFATIVGMGTLIAVWRQGNVMRDQLAEMQTAREHTKKTAEAALLNAQAVINSERPWMLINIEPARDRDGKIIAHGFFEVFFINRGRTPAEIIWFEEHFLAMPRPEEMTAPPAYLNEDIMFAHRSFIPPDGRWQHGIDSSFQLEQIFTGIVSTGDVWQDIIRSKQRAIYWGRLRYRDVVQFPTDQPRTIHETRFCYFWTPSPVNEFQMTGPAGYNDHT